MIRNRINGICFSLILGILFIDILLYQCWVYLGENRIIITLNPNANPQVYMVGIFAALLLGGRHFYEFRTRITHLGYFETGMLVLRMSMILAISTAFVYISLKDAPTSRWFLLSYLMLFTLVNAICLKLLPFRLACTLFPQDDAVRYYLLLGDSISSSLKEHLSDCRSQFGLNFQGYFSDEEQVGVEVEYLGCFKAFTRNLKEQKINPNGVLVFCNDFQRPAFLDCIKTCEKEGVRMQIYSDFFDLFDHDIQVTSDGHLHYFSPIDDPLENPIHRFVKRSLDLVISIPIVLLIVLPIMPLIWLAQRISSPGPVLYKQKRYGLNRTPFVIYKFRTMHPRETDAADEGVQASEADDRVFEFGAMMRKMSIDELPQFINVIRGEMSVVGPRPHFVEHDEDFETQFNQYRSRHFIKPGITGHAQVCGFRGEIRSHELLTNRIRCDLYYINHWTIWLDLRIILKTAWQVIFPPRTAY